MSFDRKMTLRRESSIRIRRWIYQSVDRGRFCFLLRRFFQLISVFRNQCLMHFKWFRNLHRCLCSGNFLFLFHLNFFRPQIASRLPFPVALFSPLLFDLFLRVYRFCVFFRFLQTFGLKFLHMFFFRHFGSYNVRKRILIQYGQFMERTGSGNIQQFNMPVILWVLFLCWIPQKYCIKFQPLGIHHRENHDSLSELTAFRCVTHQIRSIL